VISLNNTNEAFYRRFTLPEERKNRASTSIEWRGTYRWFASPNVVKLEDYRQSGEMGRIIILLRQRKRDEARAAAAKILAESRRRCKEQEVGV
jgi:DNA-binding GntR family transcriptional regulator